MFYASYLQGCLKTNPEERLTIDQVIQNKWVSVSGCRLGSYQENLELVANLKYN